MAVVTGLTVVWNSPFLQ